MDFNTPIKMPRSTHYGNNYYEVYSKKIGRIVRLFSNLEYANYLTLEMNPNVVKFCEQPMEISISIEDKQVKAVFDFWVKYKDGNEEFQEVKYYEELNGNDEKSIRSQEQIRREKTWCMKNNVNFSIRTDKQIYDGRFFIRNLEYLSAKVRRYIPYENNYYKSLIINHFKNLKHSTITELINKELLPIGYEIDYIAYLYYNGIVNLNLKNRPIDKRTEVSLWQTNP